MDFSDILLSFSIVDDRCTWTTVRRLQRFLRFVNSIDGVSLFRSNCTISHLVVFKQYSDQ